MNKVFLLGRLTRDPDIRYTTGNEPLCVARYTLAVDRRAKKGDDPGADFISCVAFGKSGEFAGNYLHQGSKIAVEGRIQTGSYEKADGTKVYTTDVIIENQEFAESKAPTGKKAKGKAGEEDFMQIPDDLEDEGLPFN